MSESLTPDEFRRIREIFEAALQRPPEKRAAFISAACGGDRQLHAEVQGMLAAADDRHGFLDSLAPTAEDVASRSPGPVTCESCGAALAPADRFCRICGTPVVQSGHGEEGRFRAGTLFAGRFRVVTMLGRGGMGEIYRAHDLELGHPVALKFLTAWRADPRARDRLRSEVRLARQIAHPNVCRVYDIGEAQGDLYLSMEYVDGEDLGALLKRIGRVPVDKGVDIARKLCAGLAAAHGKGVLHRDLKPANIMIDSTGEVRIMDFGLAAVTDRIEPSDVRSGTPAYMAPEQLAGIEATVQSDLYALGLILYELLTGRAPHAGSTVLELRRLRESHSTVSPSSSTPEIGPQLERAILRCLEPDPAARPRSAFAVAASLPGGNPLAEAIAAGDTPSPEMVAAFGAKEGLSRRAAWGLLAFIAAGTVAAVLLNERTSLFRHLASAKPPEVLIDGARSLLADHGSKDTPYTAYGYMWDRAVIAGVEQGKRRWDRESASRALLFFFRASPQPIPPNSIADPISIDVPALHTPGEAQVVTDVEGRVRSLQRVPDGAPLPLDRPGIDWAALARRAGVPSDVMREEMAPASMPRFPFDAQVAWRVQDATAPGRTILIHGASLGGSLVQFDATALKVPASVSASPDAPIDAPSSTASEAGVAGAFYIPPFIVLALAWLFARHNLRLGRSDRTGAARLATVLLLSGLVIWAGGSHRPSLSYELGSLALTVMAAALPLAVAVWMAYIALEPYARRRWPEVLVSWTRLTAGDWRDARVGRDLLIGCELGVTVACLSLVQALVAGRTVEGMNNSGATPLLYLAPGTVVSWTGILVGETLPFPIAFFFFFFVLRTVLRSDRLAAMVWTTIGALIGALPIVGLTDLSYAVLGVVLLGILIWTIIYWHLSRVGFVAYLTGKLVSSLFWAPLTFDPSVWYAGAGAGSLLFLAALAVVGFKISLGGRPALDRTFVHT